MATANRPRLSTKNKIGLILAGVLGTGNLMGPFGGPATMALALSSPMPAGFTEDQVFARIITIIITVGVINGLIGLATIVAVIYTVRTGKRIGARIVAGTCVPSAILAVPVFLIDLEAWLVALAAGVVVLTIAAVILVLARPADVPHEPTVA